MGQTLENPKTEKEEISGKNDYLKYALSGMQGYRISMEDDHNSESLIVPSHLKGEEENFLFSYFGVYDGHSGNEASKYLSENLLKQILLDESKKNSNIQEIFSQETLTKSFLKVDENLEILCTKESICPGSTCCTTFIKKIKNSIEIICANVGDSRCVLCDKGVTVQLSFDHKPLNEKEKERIIRSGNFVEFGRVNGSLAVSRAFGDFTYKDKKKYYT